MAVLAAMAGAPVDAQEGGSILLLLDPQGRRPAPGQEAAGELTERDYLAAGRRVQAWAVEGEEGEALVIDMVSEAIDPYLYVAGPGLTELSDDDGGDGTNSRLCVEFPASGTYQVVASAYGSDTGRYTLRADDRPSCAAADTPTFAPLSEVTNLETLSTLDRVVPWNGEAAGELTSDDPVSFGSPVQAWAIEGRAGVTLTIDLRSTAFDAYLTVLGPGLDDWITDDDGAGGCNSRVTIAFPESGRYKAVVSSVSGTMGPFTIASYEDPPAPAAGRCIPPSAGAGSELIGDLPVAGSVAVGASATGELTDEARYQNRPAERWTLEARSGQRLAVQQTSDALDSYLYLRGPGFAQPLFNDDVDGTLDSRICLTVPETGTYDIVSAGFGADDVGPYRLAVTPDPDGEICDDFMVSLQSAFSPIPLEGTALAPGVEVSGSLDATDERHPVDGSLIDVYGLEATAGESLVVDLVSDAFDAFLYLVGPGLADPLIDDDGGGRCNARIDLVAPRTGSYRVVVNSLAADGAGEYRLRVSSEAGPVAEGGCMGTAPAGTAVSDVPVEALDAVRPVPGRELPMGAEVTGALTESDPTIEEGRHAQAWSLRAPAGETVVVELVSDDFDAFLYLTGPGLDGVLVDDDGATGTNARITFAPGSAGTYRVIVSSYGDDSVGAFRLRALRQVGGR